MTRFFGQRPPATVLLEACGSSHHWARSVLYAARRSPQPDRESHLGKGSAPKFE
jgi:fructoselysine-6-P-deglycase FrlB-like protein